MTAISVKITVRGNKEFSFIIENNFTLEYLAKIFFFIIMCLPGCSHLFPIDGYIKLSSHADRFEVKEGPKGCPLLFWQNLEFLLRK
jgi:hypothetical protein